jgi:tRNA(Ile2)-agmatinylcytidine synthase
VGRAPTGTRRTGGGTIWLGVDDTDSPRGGCTTWVLTELLSLARESSIDLIGEPRLVRLNPNIPWKTRGNAALSARFGRGRGRRWRVGEVAGKPVWAYRSGRPLSPSTEQGFREAAWTRVLAGARSEKGTDPALVVTNRRLPADVYWRAVREVVPVMATLRVLEQVGAWWRTRTSERGLVGAAAAIAWAGHHPSWEVTTYRPPQRWGEPRQVDATSVRRAARRFPELFLCDDPRTRRILVAPHSPCPILFGLRGTDAASLLAARREVRSEPVERWVLFRTNQGSGDHLKRRSVRELGPYLSAQIDTTVARTPESLAGGHVRLEVTDREGAPLHCLAFEPTKTLPRVVRSLVAGDRVVVWGGRGHDPTFRLEGIRLVRLAPRFGPPKAPTCTGCGRRARSLGTARGYRCPACHRRWPPEAVVLPRTAPRFPLGEYHPTPSARRHLHPRGPEP